MSERAELKIGGRTYQVVSSASQTELARLARRVEEALSSVDGQEQLRRERGLVLAALKLAYDAEQAELNESAQKMHYQSRLAGFIGELNQLLGESERPLPTRRAPARKFEVQLLQQEEDARSQETLLEAEPARELGLAEAAEFNERAPLQREVRNIWGEDLESFADSSARPSYRARGNKDEKGR